MQTAVDVVIVGVLVLAVSAGARRAGFPGPLALLAAGMAVSFVPGSPSIALTPDLVLLGLLPPLLYQAAVRTVLVDVRRDARAIGMLSVGLVIFTTVGVGLVAWWFLPVPFAAALALGAVVAPPDAVAATAVARHVGMPRRVVSVLEGESLVNDATALVALRAAIAALGGTVTLAWLGQQVLLSAVGGAAIGVAVAFAVAKVRRRVDDTLTDVGLSLVTPWLAYLPAEHIHASGVLAVVVAGLVIGHASPAIQSAQSRILESTNWATIGFVLEGAVFLLIGLQLRAILRDAADSGLTVPTVALATAAVFAAMVALRLAWVSAAWGARLLRAAADAALGGRELLVVGWAGMRGVVTLAAVFLLPMSTPYRDVLVFIAFAVTVLTLTVQGLTLPWLTRRLVVRGPGFHEDMLQQASVYQRAVQAGQDRLEEIITGDEPPEVLERLRADAARRADSLWEAMGSGSPAALYARLRREMLAAERAELLAQRDSGRYDSEVLRPVLGAVDLEEVMLGRVIARDGRARATELRGRWDARCAHLDAPDMPGLPPPGDVCPACVAEGTRWVQLRQCVACGAVGCCDSSPAQHARRHFDETGHPVVRSAEPGEAWRWCYVDRRLG